MAVTTFKTERSILPRIEKDPHNETGWAAQIDLTAHPVLIYDEVIRAFLEEYAPEKIVEIVKRDWRVLQYVDKQTPEMCLAAVNDSRLRFAKKRELRARQAGQQGGHCTHYPVLPGILFTLPARAGDVVVL